MPPRASAAPPIQTTQRVPTRSSKPTGAGGGVAADGGGADGTDAGGGVGGGAGGGGSAGAAACGEAGAASAGGCAGKAAVGAKPLSSAATLESRRQSSPRAS